MRKRLPEDVLKYFRAEGRRGGKRAGETMTPAARRERARKASQAAAKVRTAAAKARKQAKGQRRRLST